MRRDRARPGRRRRRPPPSRAPWISGELVRVLAAGGSWSFAFSCFTLLPTYLIREIGAGPSAIGLVMGVFGWSSVALTPLCGAAVDRHRHRRTILAGALLTAATSACFLAVRSVGPAMLALRVAQALSNTLVATAVGVAVAEIAPPERLSQALGLGGASILVMNAVAPAAAEPLAAALGWSAVFAMSSAAALAAAATAWTLPERGGRARHPEPSSTLALLRRPVALHYALVVVLVGLASGTIFTFQQPFALELGRERVRGFLVAFAAAATLVRLILGHVPDRYGRERVAKVSLAVYGLAALALPGLPASGMEPLGAVFGIAHGLFYPALNAIAMNAVARHERGRLMAIFTGAFNLGVSGTALLGLVAERAGYPALFHVAGAAALAGTVVLALSRELRETPAAAEAEPLVASSGTLPPG